MNRDTSINLIDRPSRPVRAGLIVLTLTLAAMALPAVARTPYRSDAGRVTPPHHYPPPLNQAAEHAHTKGAHGTTAGMRATQQRLRGNKEAGLAHIPSTGPGPLAEHHHWPDNRASHAATRGR